VGTPDSTLTIGAVIALTGNASVIGQDQRLGLELARDHFQGNVQGKGPALKLTIQDGGSDEATATNAFRSLIGANVVALACPFVARVAPPCSMPKTTPTRPRSRRSFSRP
jgi:branched-chain amino acid transport system substrate-binding protein